MAMSAKRCSSSISRWASILTMSIAISESPSTTSSRATLPTLLCTIEWWSDSPRSSLPFCKGPTSAWRRHIAPWAIMSNPRSVCKKPKVSNPNRARCLEQPRGLSRFVGCFSARDLCTIGRAKLHLTDNIRKVVRHANSVADLNAARNGSNEYGEPTEPASCQQPKRFTDDAFDSCGRLHVPFERNVHTGVTLADFFGHSQLCRQSRRLGADF